MADGMETIGWIMSVEDKATDQVKKIAATMDGAVTRQSIKLSKWNDTLTSWQKEQSPLGKAAGGIVRSFSNVFGELMLETQDGIIAMSKNVAEGAVAGMSSVAQAPGKLVESVKGFSEKLMSVKDSIKNIKLSWKGVAVMSGQVIGKSVAALANQGHGVVSLFKDKIPGALKAVKNKLFGIKAESRKAASSTNGVLQNFISMEKVALGLKKIGGIGGVLLGPLAPILKLFRPIIDAITKQLTPAMETFTAIIDTAFAPFGEILEVVAQNLATELVPHLKPIGQFLGLMAIKVGGMITDLLKGDGFKNIVTTVQKALVDMIPVGFKLVEASIKLGAALLPLVPALIKLTIKMLPLLIQFADWMVDSGVPFIEKYMPKFVKLIEWVVDKVVEFWGNLPKYALQMQLLIFDPVTSWFKEVGDDFKKLWVKVKKGLIDPLVKFLQPVIDKTTALIENIKMLTGNDQETADNEESARKTGFTQAASLAKMNEDAFAKAAGTHGLTGAARNAALDKYMRSDAYINRNKGMAEGGITQGPLNALIGEAGPEMVLPLNRSTMSDVLTPILPKLDVPALKQLTDIVTDIRRRLDGVIMVDSVRRDDDNRDPFGVAAGMQGMGAW